RVHPSSVVRPERQDAASVGRAATAAQSARGPVGCRSFLTRGPRGRPPVAAAGPGTRKAGAGPAFRVDRLVGETGFEPATSTSRTGFWALRSQAHASQVLDLTGRDMPRYFAL